MLKALRLTRHFPDQFGDLFHLRPPAREIMTVDVMKLLCLPGVTKLQQMKAMMWIGFVLISAANMQRGNVNERRAVSGWLPAAQPIFPIGQKGCPVHQSSSAQSLQ